MIEIYKENLLGLTTKSFIGRESTLEDGLNIVQYGGKEDGNHWVIAEFVYNKKESCWEINSICDRMNDSEINWETFGKIIHIGYGILEWINPRRESYYD